MGKQEIRSNSFFEKGADLGTKEKVLIVSYYASLFFNIIGRTKYVKNILYFDPYSGRGYFENGFLSVPPRVLTYGLKYDNIDFYFNDLYQSCSLRAFIEKLEKFNVLKERIKISGIESESIDIEHILKDYDACFAYIDSFSQGLASPKDVSKILKKKYCDAAVFFNYREIARFHSSSKGIQKNRMIDFFGGDVGFQKVSCDILDNPTLDDYEKIKRIIKYYLVELSKWCGKRVYGLPVFFYQSKEGSVINNVMMFLSKDTKGIYELLNKFANKVSGSHDQEDFYFYIQNQRLVVYEDNMNYTEPLFDLDDFDGSSFLRHLPTDPNKAINEKEFIRIIRDDFQNKFGYLSCINDSYLKKVLRKFEDSEKILCIRNGKGCRKFTYGDQTLIYRNEKNN